MKIFVCLKQVPDTETKIKIAGDNSSIDTNGIKWVMNPYDEFAVEEAIKTRDANPGSQVWVLTVGPKKRSGDALITALAMGCDEGILIDAPENLDPLVSAKALAAAIKAEGSADLIFTGKVAIDDNASSVPQMLAELLNIPHCNVVSKVTLTPESIICERDSEGGAREIVHLQRPAVIGANRGLNKPRYASMPGILKARKKVLKNLDLAALAVTDTGKVKTVSLELPPGKPSVKMFQGTVDQQVSGLVTALRDEAKVL